MLATQGVDSIAATAGNTAANDLPAGESCTTAVGNNNGNAAPPPLCGERCNEDASAAGHPTPMAPTATATKRTHDMANLSAASSLPPGFGSAASAVPKKTKRRRRRKPSKANRRRTAAAVAAATVAAGAGNASWRCQMTRNRPRRPPSLHSGAGNNSVAFDADGGGGAPQRSSLVPYNTNVFLMEEHEPPQRMRGVSRRQRNASCSMDETTTANTATTTEDEQQQQRVDQADDGDAEEEEEETDADFLSREFSSVYEDARSERLDNMSKAQLVREYLQMEANYNKLSNHLRQRAEMMVGAATGGGRSEQRGDRELRHRAHALEQQVQELSAQIHGECGGGVMHCRRFNQIIYI